MKTFTTPLPRGLQYHILSRDGDGAVTTWALRFLAAKAFEASFSGAPAPLPSRLSMLTGVFRTTRIKPSVFICVHLWLIGFSTSVSADKQLNIGLAPARSDGHHDLGI
jgi:hypothetical protein